MKALKSTRSPEHYQPSSSNKALTICLLTYTFTHTKYTYFHIDFLTF